VLVQRNSRYAPEFRRGSARYVLESGRLIAELAEGIGVSASTLRKWRNRELEFPHLNEKNSYGDLLAENARLRREQPT
jgi:transposase-like protein